MERSGRKRIIMRDACIAAGFLLVLLVCSLIYDQSIRAFNQVQRTYKAGDAPGDLRLSIVPRSGQTDAWVKRTGAEETGDLRLYYGAIYDITLDNIGPHTISNWSLALPIPESCYLNNGWCGTFDIDQTAHGTRRTQNLDLRNYILGDLRLDYLFDATDLLIPLGPGDSALYRPDAATDEYPVASAQSRGGLNSVVFGMILYTADDHLLSFPDYTVNYYLKKEFTGGWEFIALLCGCMVWLLMIVSFASVEWNMRKAHLRFEQDGRIIQQSIGVFTHFFEAKDVYTNGHSQRVAKYAKLISEKLGFSPDECRRVYYIALMHDCGKCYIPDEILKKPGKLTREEFDVIKSHTVRGAEMMEYFTSVEHIREGALYHHERYDGGGYPTGLAGESIPLVSRIICVADSFDAMNSRRCYRDMLSTDYILSELKNGRGTQFDPQLTDVLLALISEGKVTFHEQSEG